MKIQFKKVTSLIIALLLASSLASCAESIGSDSKDSAISPEESPESVADSFSSAHIISLSSDTAQLDGTDIPEYDYTWNVDPGVSHDDVKNAPAEYYTGSRPDDPGTVFIDHELYYYPELPESGFRCVRYDGESEWAYYYTDGEHDEYIFATLPVLDSSFPTQMMNSADEAAKNSVLHITEPGEYILEGKWNGQIWVDLGDKDDTFTDESKRITVILGGVNIECSVAPGIVFYSAYECDNTWEDQATHSAAVDTANAGVDVIIADGTNNTITGKNVFRMLKTVYKDENSTDTVKTQKKMRKTDGALYSYVTMNIDGGEKGDGTLTVNSGFEGIDSELHMALNGGIITVNSQDDGMNVNEDNVSVIIFNGADVTINAALGAEGDGVDSNGFIVLNGGTVRINGITPPDSALDSEDGIHYNGGTVIIDGSEQNYESGSVFRETGNMGGFMEGMAPGEGFKENMGRASDLYDLIENFDMKTFKEKVAAMDDNASVEDLLKAMGVDLSMLLKGSGIEPPDGMGDVRGFMPSDRQPGQAPGGNIPEGQRENAPPNAKN